MVDVAAGELPEPGSRVHADVSVRAGGSAVNAALAAAAAGASATVVGRIGADPAGDLVAAALQSAGVEPCLTRDTDLSTGAAVALGDPGSPAVVAQRGANARLSPDDVPEPLEADALLVSGFALFQRGSAEAARAALDRFRGTWAGVDAASPKLAEAAGGEIPGVNVILATAAEARALTGREPEDAARELAKRFEVACVKLGPGGAIAVQGEQVERCRGEAVGNSNPFGAGDAFAAILLVALARGEALATALEQACRAGARAASRRS